MKKYKLKRWVETVLYIIEAALFFSLLFIVEKNPIALICNKFIGAGLFLLIGSILVNYTTDCED